jgi:hypothetical protein
MLVIVSDLHLTDGTTGLRMPVGAFRTFRQRVGRYGLRCFQAR